MKYVQVFRLAPVFVFCDVTERVSVRGFGGPKRQRKKTGKIFQISARTKSYPTERGGVKLSFYLIPISAGGGGGWNPPPPGFSLAIATKINRSTPNFLTFNFFYRDII